MVLFCIVLVFPGGPFFWHATIRTNCIKRAALWDICKWLVEAGMKELINNQCLILENTGTSVTRAGPGKMFHEKAR
jgi:predicted NUDIX family NTP pyrophosphohydrolase